MTATAIDPGIAISEKSVDKTQHDQRPIWMKIAQEVPGINFFYDMFGDEDPTFDGLKDSLNLLGLIDALILGFVLSAMCAVNFDELTSADDRFVTSDDSNFTGYHKLYLSNNYPPAADRDMYPSSFYARNCMYSIVFLFVSLLTVLLTYLDFSNKNFQKLSEFESARLFSCWWKYAKWCVAFGFGGTLTGVIYGAGLVASIVAVKYPDSYVAVHGTLVRSPKHPYQGYYDIANPIISFLAINFFILGLGTRCRYREEFNISAERDISKKEATREKELWHSLLVKAADVIPKIEINKLLENIVVEHRVLFKSRGKLTDESFKDFGIYRVGYRIIYLELIEKSVNDDF